MNQNETKDKPEKTVPEKGQTASSPLEATASRLFSSNNVQAFSMAIFSLFALAFFSIFAIKPTLNSFFQLRREIADAETLDVELSDKIRSLLRAQEEYYQLQSELSLLDDALPQAPEFPDLLRKIETVTAEEQTEIVSFTTRDFSLLTTQGPDAAVESGLTDMLFTLELLSSYTNNESVLTRLANVRRIILFERLAMTANPAEGGNNIELEITAKAFHHGTGE